MIYNHLRKVINHKKNKINTIWMLYFLKSKHTGDITENLKPNHNYFCTYPNGMVEKYTEGEIIKTKLKGNQ